MRLHRIVLATALLSSAGVAQLNPFELYPGQTDFTSRGNAIWAKAGETLQGIHASHHRGIGDTGAGCEIHAFGANLQDQDRSTQEVFHWSVRRGADATGPAVGANDVVARIGPLITPFGGGIGAFSVTTNLATPVKLECASFFAYGLRLSPAPTWPNDGLSTHISSGTQPNTQLIHANAEDHAWEIALGATAASNPSLQRTWRYRLFTRAPVLQMCNNGGTCGMGGMFPLSGIGLGTVTRWGTGMAGGNVLLYLGTSRTPGLQFAQTGPRLYLGGFLLPLGGAQIPASGTVFSLIANQVPPGLGNSGTVYFQAIATKGSMMLLSNVGAVTP